MLKFVKLLIAIVLFSIFSPIHYLEANPPTHIQFVKNKKNNKKKNKPSFEKTKYELTLCCISRDEAEYLPEWIEFHINQGIEHIYLYDNLTKRDLQEVLRAYVEKGLIDIVPWPYEHHDDPSWANITAYKNYLHLYGKETEWCAFIDTDEFLFCPDGKNLKEFLRSYKRYQEVMVCWIMYGTGGVWEAPKGKLIQSLFYRAPDHFHLAMKPIVKTRDVVNVASKHYFDVRDSSKVVTENFQRLNFVDGGYCPKVQSVDKIRINHYAFRDGKFFEEVKIPRYQRRGISRIDALGFEALMNVVYDDSILKCVH